MPRTPDPRTVRVHEALVLRRWALPALCGGTEPAPDASVGGWGTFLRTERCAAQLAALGDAMLGSGAAEVRRRATTEAQRILSATAQLHLIGRMARREGWTVAALKGGVPLAEGRPGADLVDVDVLAAPDQARALGRALDEAGYASYGRASSHRLEERIAPGGVQVEVHTGVPGIGTAEGFLGRAVPSRVGGVLAPHPADHLWHLLVHTVAQHAGRRGSLRELVILADALGRCAAEDVAAVQARFAARRDGRALQAQLELARALRERRPPPEDPFAVTAAAMYLSGEHLGPLKMPYPLKSVVAEAGMLAVAARAGTPPPRGQEGEEAAPRNALGRLARRVPAWLAFAPAHLLARAAERAVRAERRAREGGEVEGGGD